jgi:arabinose-5-phosphate isomerase
MNPGEVIALGQRVVRMESEALAEAASRIGEDFAAAVDLIVRSSGRVILSGVGKSGLIARKIAATLTSTGTPATFLHPTESLHGDLGMVGNEDVAILVSKSGAGDEMLTLLAHLRRFGAKVIALTGAPESPLSRESDARLDGWVREEACPHDLAPTTSTTVALALGDALAVAILQRKGFRAEDFARFHPGGALGRKLLLRVRDIMETQRLPVVPPETRLREVIVLLAERRGIVVVSSEGGGVAGVFTAGDFARLMERETAPFDRAVGDLMSRSPRVASVEELASAVVYRMEQSGIMAMPVLDGAHCVVGVVHLHDLMRAGVA